MNQAHIRKSVFAAFLITALAGVAHSQGGACKDPWINQAYNQLYHRAPSGSGLGGECNITLYGGGHWSNYNDLVAKVEAVKGAPAARPATMNRPAATLPTTSAAPLALTPSQELARRSGAGTAFAPENPNGNRVAPSRIISQDGGGLISDAGGNIVAAGGGNLVSNSSGTMRSVQSVDKPRAPAGRYLVIPGGNLVDANGNVVRQAGSYTIVVRNGANSIGTGGHAPVAGTVVNP